MNLPLPFKYSNVTGRKSRKSQKACNTACKTTLDTVLKNKRSGKRNSAPQKGELMEKDPIAEELSNPSDLPENLSDHSSDYDDKAHKQDIQTESGSLQIARHAIPKRIKQVKKLCVQYAVILYTHSAE